MTLRLRLLPSFARAVRPRTPKPPPPAPRPEADLVAEAQADLNPTLNSVMGACFAPAAILRRYQRHLEAERDSRPKWVVFGMLFWGPAWEGILVAVACIIGFAVIGSELTVCILSGLLIGAGATWLRACRKMYNRVYADLYCSRNPDSYAPWQSEQILRGKVMRLAFKDRLNTVFYGSYASGYIRLETNEDVSEFSTMTELYQQRAGQQQLAEAALLDSHARMRVTEANGLTIHNTRKRSLGEQLAQNFGFITGVICLVIAAYCLLQMQDGEMLGRPDVKERQATIERLEQERMARDDALRDTRREQ